MAKQLEFYFPKTKSKHMATPVTGKVYPSKGGTVRYGVQASMNGSMSLPKYVKEDEFNNYGFSVVKKYPQEFLDAFYDFDSNPTADTQDDETVAIAYQAWYQKKAENEVLNAEVNVGEKRVMSRKDYDIDNELSGFSNMEVGDIDLEDYQDEITESVEDEVIEAIRESVDDAMPISDGESISSSVNVDTELEITVPISGDIDYDWTANETYEDDRHDDEWNAETVSFHGENYRNHLKVVKKAPYGGIGSLFGIGGDTELGGFSTSELTGSSAIHGDFDSASLNYSGHQNLQVRAETFEAQGYTDDEMIQAQYPNYFLRQKFGDDTDERMEQVGIYRNLFIGLSALDNDTLEMLKDVVYHDPEWNMGEKMKQTIDNAREYRNIHYKVYNQYPTFINSRNYYGAETEMEGGVYKTTCDCGTVLTWDVGMFNTKDKDGNRVKSEPLEVERLEFPSRQFDHYEQELSLKCPTCGEYHTCEIEAPVYHDRLEVNFGAETFGAEMMMCSHCSNEGKENPMFDYDMGGVSDCLGCGDTMCQEHYESDSHRGCEGFHAESVGSPSPSSPLEEVPATVPSPAEPTNESFNAEMDELDDTSSIIRNQVGDMVGMVELDENDEDIEKVDVDIIDDDGEKAYEGTLGAETFEAQPTFNEENQEYEGTIKEIYKDPKTNEIRVKGRWFFPQRGEWVEYDEKGCQYEGCSQMNSPEWYDEDYCTTACANDMKICGKNKPYSNTSYGSTRLVTGWQDGAYGTFCQSLTEDEEGMERCNDCDYEASVYGAETFESQGMNTKMILGITALAVGLGLWKGKEILSISEKIRQSMKK